MIFDITTYTYVHVLLSFVGILSGFIVLYGLLTANRMENWTLVFLATTLATSLTGFGFPFGGFTPAYWRRNYFNGRPAGCHPRPLCFPSGRSLAGSLCSRSSSGALSQRLRADCAGVLESSSAAHAGARRHGTALRHHPGGRVGAFHPGRVPGSPKVSPGKRAAASGVRLASAIGGIISGSTGR